MNIFEFMDKCPWITVVLCVTAIACLFAIGDGISGMVRRKP